MPGQGYYERDNALKEWPRNTAEWIRANVKQADPSGFNWEYVMGPGDESPRISTEYERKVLGLKAPDLCECGPMTRATYGCDCGALEDPLYRGGHPEYRKVLGERMQLHVEKSSGYGNDDDAFANFTAVASLTGQPRYLYPVHRTIEKLTRVLSLHAQGRTDELEEEFKDCASLLDCATAMLRVDGSKTS